VGKPGEPTKFGATKRAAYLAALGKGTGRYKAAKAVGMSAEGVRDYARKHPEFAEEIAVAEMDANEAVECALYRRATEGNIAAICIWLFNRMPDRWADKRHVQHEGDVTIKTPQEIEAMQQEIKALDRQFARLTGNNGDESAS